ncbi:MAG: HypC/HybG/HupF family hydrogenase formation chaperone [Proteobacteria bacterium]|nr:HypC/HybG/HupF family hydrogenase formation chaperone [Pseudomonadota bacterium]MBU4297074.1 HypC/HybG/HupF family hydrogenase formation chaperone [Pseudomonadota bacterium]MCG2749955.1 HypC/HybG/HupF family hydrogenase formation chaperone [Desulfobulbaceae bacterium]
MCLAVPMRVIAVKGVENDFTTQQLGVVEAQGIEKEVRLDLVDHWPEIGDYLIIHAGFAIHTLDAAEAETNLRLLRELADNMQAAAGEEKR